MFHKVAATPILVLMAIIFISGILGGIVNYLMNRFSKRWNIYKFIKSLLFGILFAAIAMFVLESTTTDLIKSNQPPLDYLVSGCICFLSCIVCSILLNVIWRLQRAQN